MKTFIFALTMFAGLMISGITGCANAQTGSSTANAEFTVKGLCGMCKTRIENAAKSAGATTAVWDAKEQKITVAFDSKKTTEEKIHQAIAKAGHDTSKFRADDATYEKLNGCCKYERIPKE